MIKSIFRSIKWVFKMICWQPKKLKQLERGAIEKMAMRELLNVLESKEKYHPTCLMIVLTEILKRFYARMEV